MPAKKSSRKKAVAPARKAKAAAAPRKHPKATLPAKPTSTKAKRVSSVTLSPASHAAIAAMQKSLHLETADEAIALAARLAKSLDSVPNAASLLVVIELDGIAKEYRFATSDALELRGWIGTEADLVTQAATKTNRSISAIARDGALLNAKRELAMAQRAAARAAEPPPTDGSRRQTAGIPGAADARIKEVYDQLIADNPNQKITPARLAGMSGTGFYTAKRWLDRYVETDG